MFVYNSLHHWNSTCSHGLEILTLDKNDHYLAGDDYFVEVKSDFGHSAFTVLAFIEKTNGYYIELDEGIPQLGEVFQGSHQYFKYTTDKQGWVTISLSDITGDTDICITKENPDVKPDPPNCWKSKMEVGSDILTFEHEENVEVTYYIGIYGYDDDSYYNILITHSGVDIAAVVPESFPIGGILENRFEYHYFKYYLPPHDPLSEGVLFSLNRRSAFGDADLYISRHNSKGGYRPIATNYTWKSDNYQGEADIKEVRYDGEFGQYFSAGWFYIGVRCFSPPVRYDLTVSREDGHTVLVKGKSFRSPIKPDKGVYFMFNYEDPHSRRDDEDVTLDIFIEPTNGIIDLYTSTTFLYPDEENCDEVNVEHIGMITVIHINNPIDGWYYMTAISSSYSQFTITASISSKENFIVVGQTATGSVEYHEFKYFIAEIGVGISQDLQIALTTTNNANADLYIRTDKNPTNTTAMWSAHGHYGADVIRIDHTDPNLHVSTFEGNLFIGIYGESSSRSYFTLMVSYENSTIELKNGIPTPGSVQKDEERFYKYYMVKDGRLTFNLEIFDDLHRADADLFVANAAFGVPHRHHYMYYSMKAGSKLDYVTFNATAGLWYVTVVGWTDTNTTYTITASGDHKMIYPYGIQSIDTVGKGKWRYYTTNIANENSDNFFVGLTLISGSTNLFIINSTDKPNLNMYHKKDDTNWPYNFLDMDIKNVDHKYYKRWTFGVYGQDTSTYLIHCSAPVITDAVLHYQGKLKPNIPFIGKAYQSSTQYFQVNAFAETTKYFLYVRLFPKSDSSQLNIYIDQNNPFPDVSSFYVSVIDKSVGVYEINGVELNKYFYIAVKSEGEDLSFQFSLSSSEDPIYITQEYPLYFETQPNEAGMFELFSAPQGSDEDFGLSIVLHSCTERIPPVFYVSVGDYLPNSTYYSEKSVSTHQYCQKVVNDTYHFLNHPYYITTGISSFAQQFSIYAFTREDFRPVVVGEINVVDITEQRAEIQIPRASSTHFSTLNYYVYLREITGDEKISNINVHTACAITRSNKFILAGYRTENVEGSEKFTHDITIIQPNRKYAIVVVVETEHQQQSVIPPVVIETGTGDSLVLGQARYYSINKDETQNYNIDALPIGDMNKHLFVALTPFDGDVDIEVTVNGRSYNGTSFGFDVVDIEITEQTTLGPFSVVITAPKSNCKFSLLAYVNEEGKYISLSDGSPQLMANPPDEHAYFKFELDDDSSFSVGVTPISGDPDIFVSTTVVNPSLDNCHVAPGEPKICWKSRETTLDFIEINSNDPLFVPEGVYYIGIHAWSVVSTYTVVALKEESLEEIASGIPYGRHVKRNGYVYFKFELTHDTDLSLVLSPFSIFGDPDIFVSKIHHQPDSRNCEWKSNDHGSDFLQISEGGIGVYFISVLGYNHDLDFQLTVTGTEKSVLLVDGITQYVFQQIPGTIKYFRTVHAYFENSIHISAQARSGQFKMYASLSPDPTSEKHDFVGHHEGGMVFIDIPKSDKRKFKAKMIYIGIEVIGVDSSSYHISVSTVQRPTVLYNGELSPYGTVLFHFYKYYEFNIPDDLRGMGVFISLLGSVGDPDLYVSCIENKPTKDEGKFQWKSRSGARDSLFIKGDELEAQDCPVLHIGVYGFSTSQFQIMAFIENVTQPLYEDIPVPGYIESGYHQYVFKHDHNGSIFINLKTRTSGADGDLYVDTRPHPNEHRHLKASTHIIGDDYIRLDDVRDITFYIAVHCYKNRPFEYTLSVSCEYSQVIDGDQNIQFAEAGGNVCFKTNLKLNSESLVAGVTPINGMTVLYANPSDELPEEGNAMYKADNYPNILSVKGSDFKGQQFPTVWSFCVSILEDADFWFGASSDKAYSLLESGKPRVSGFLEGEEVLFKYYQIDEDENKDYYILVNGYGTSAVPACFIIYASQTSDKPDHDTSPWHGKTGGVHDFVLVELDGIDRAVENNHLYISVKGCSKQSRDLKPLPTVTPFSIMIVNSVDPVVLMHERIVTFADSYTNYVFRTSEHATKIIFELDSCSNVRTSKTKLLISNDEGKTYLDTKYANDKYSLNVNTDSITVLDNYFVKVESEKKHHLKKFSLFVSTQDDPRPVVPEAAVITAIFLSENRKDGTAEYSITTTVSGKGHPTDELEYHLYYAALDRKIEYHGLPQDYNYWTVCAITKSDKSISGGAITDISKGSIKGKLTVPIDQDIIVNIIVENQYSVRSVYKPTFIRRRIDTNNPGAKIGGVIIGISVGIVSLVLVYFLVGIIIKVTYFNAKGMEVIPHISFFRRVFGSCCGGKKGGRRYRKFKEEEIGDELKFNDEENPFQPDNSQIIEDDMGKYGSL